MRTIKKGDKFGRLTVVKVTRGVMAISCRCVCGTRVAPHRGNLIAGRTRSCGCLHHERITRHGQQGSPEYAIWQAVVQRCTNKKNRSYKNYGGRGIKLYPAWRDFRVFIKAVGPRPHGKGRMTIERKNNERGYVPGNVRWAPYSVQNRNKRTNRYLTYRGRRQCLIDWARETGVSTPTIIRRLAEGWSVSRALTTPPLERGRRVWRRRHPAAQVAEIRATYVKGRPPFVRDLARAYGVSKSTIGYVVSGGTWEST